MWKKALNGLCPICGEKIKAMKYSWRCSCGFTIPYEIAQRRITEEEAEEIVREGKTAILDGFTSRAGAPFKARLRIDYNGKVGLEFPDDGKEKEKHSELEAKCPKCHGTMIPLKYGWACENRCGTFIPYKICERRIAEDEANSLLWQGRTLMLKGFISRKGKPFNAFLELGKDGKTKLAFPDHSEDEN